jgi:hypothetical protein
VPALIAYRQVLVGRSCACPNRIRALPVSQGLSAPRGHRTWTELSLQGIGQHAQSLAECAGDDLWRGLLAIALTEYCQVRELIDQAEANWTRWPAPTRASASWRPSPSRTRRRRRPSWHICTSPSASPTANTSAPRRGRFPGSSSRARRTVGQADQVAWAGANAQAAGGERPGDAVLQQLGAGGLPAPGPRPRSRVAMLPQVAISPGMLTAREEEPVSSPERLQKHTRRRHRGIAADEVAPRIAAEQRNGLWCLGANDLQFVAVAGTTSEPCWDDPLDYALFLRWVQAHPERVHGTPKAALAFVRSHFGRNNLIESSSGGRCELPPDITPQLLREPLNSLRGCEIQQGGGVDRGSTSLTAKRPSLPGRPVPKEPCGHRREHQALAVAEGSASNGIRLRPSLFQ